TGAYLAALFAILGHTMPVYYKFKGGKGVVSSAIAILLLDWQVGVVVIGVFAIVLIISRFVSLSSIIAAFAYPGIIFIFNNVRFKGEALPDAAAMMFAFFVGIYVIFLHRTNIARIYNREENKLDFKKLFKRKKPIENAEDTPEE
ncbi:glycerol-3-phosphate acyltransferase, partial [Eubacteriales bacterium OttesenSCG-928-G02]|nr:glycerol-3-phosphate acyltransferase [Eubacteriales bacterium OttesenSCG-928-G02]